jgi:hypothetical protein
MIIYFHNHQDKLDPNNRRAISSDDELIELLDHARHAPPFVAEFCGAVDFHIIVGIGGDFGRVQFSRMDGMPPYLMAVSPRPPVKRGVIEFMCGGTPTPIGSSNILRFDELKAVLMHFMRTGERSDTVTWRPVRPGDTKEDAERPSECLKVHARCRCVYRNGFADGVFPEIICAETQGS